MGLIHHVLLKSATTPGKQAVHGEKMPVTSGELQGFCAVWGLCNNNWKVPSAEKQSPK